MLQWWSGSQGHGGVDIAGLHNVLLTGQLCGREGWCWCWLKPALPLLLGQSRVECDSEFLAAVAVAAAGSAIHCPTLCTSPAVLLHLIGGRERGEGNGVWPWSFVVYTPPN